MVLKIKRSDQDLHLPVIETGALPWKGNMLPLHQRCIIIFQNLRSKIQPNRDL
jgi:hypothetical protein